MIELSKSQALLFIVDAFLITEISEWFLAFSVSPILRKVFPTLPLFTFLPVAALSMVFGGGFLCLMLKDVPPIRTDAATFRSILPGIVVIWLELIITKSLFSSGQAYLDNLPRESIALYLVVSIILSPVFEEFLVRGCYFEILRQSWGEKLAIKLTTFLFVLPHLIWHPSNRQVLSILSLTVSSLVYTYVYKYGGILPAISTHMFYNFYVLCVL